ncbi:MAG: ATP synthase F0 subunit A [Pedosphaera sp.]|nr:ATP synthase F0 subunit A [Pedosphaera sp.]
MSLKKTILTAAVLLGFAAFLNAAEPGHEAAVDGAAPHAGHVGPPVSPEAPTLFHIGPLPVTNSIVYTWIIGAVILFVIRAGTKKMKETPSGVQNVVEAAVEGLEELTKGLLEPKVAHWVFPLAATFFLFIVVSNLMGLLPGVGSIGWGHASGAPFGIEHADTPLFRPPTADANMTVAMAAIFFVMSTIWALKYNGPVGLLKHIFGVKGGMTGWIVIPLSLIFIFIGCIEVISIMIRPVALAMRLYGNIYGGESVLTLMLTNSPLGLAALPFYFLELLVAVVQALVFTLLSIAFIGTLCSHTEEEHAGAKHAH